jgi:cytochrome P450
MVWSPQYGGHWIAARAHVMEEVLSNFERFSSRRLTVVPGLEPPIPSIPLQVDPPDHTKYRQLLMNAFSPKSVTRLGENTRRLAIDLIEGFKHRGHCEFIGDFATHLPIGIFLTMVDLPIEDRTGLLKIVESVIRPQSVESAAAGRLALFDYIQIKIEERRRKPGNDLISDLVQAEIDGQPITLEKLKGMLVLVLMAGLDTVASMMGFFALFLATNPLYRKRLMEQPDRIASAVEELLRRFPIANLYREVKADCEMFGASLKAGEMILIPTVAYGLDDRRFDNPETVDFGRVGKIHGTFGGGLHRCMGSMLARVELRIFLEEWLTRIPDFAVKTGERIVAKPGNVIGIERLPLVWATR